MNAAEKANMVEIGFEKIRHYSCSPFGRHNVFRLGIVRPEGKVIENCNNAGEKPWHWCEEEAFDDAVKIARDMMFK